MYNSITIVGRLGGDPELRYTPEGTPVCNFSVAVNRPMANKDQEQTDWFRIVVWNKSAENCANYLKKGNLVLISGRLQVRQYQDREGQTRTAVEIVANRVVFLTPKNHDETAGGPDEPEYNDEDVPF